MRTCALTRREADDLDINAEIAERYFQMAWYDIGFQNGFHAFALLDGTKITMECGFRRVDRPPVRHSGYRLVDDQGRAAMVLFDQIPHPAMNATDAVSLLRAIGRDHKVRFYVSLGGPAELDQDVYIEAARFGSEKIMVERGDRTFERCASRIALDVLDYLEREAEAAATAARGGPGGPAAPSTPPSPPGAA